MNNQTHLKKKEKKNCLPKFPLKEKKHSELFLFNTLISLALQLIAVALNCASVHHKEIFSCQDTCRHPDLSYFQEQDVKNCSNAQEIIFSNSSINVIFIISVSTEILLLFFCT